AVNRSANGSAGRAWGNQRPRKGSNGFPEANPFHASQGRKTASAAAATGSPHVHRRRRNDSAASQAPWDATTGNAAYFSEHAAPSSTPAATRAGVAPPFEVSAAYEARPSQSSGRSV